LTRQLQLAGFETAVANHGLECLEILDSSTFDVILMDLFMPQMSGLEATAEIRRREASGQYPSRTPVIAVTGNARTEYVDKGTNCLAYSADWG
jgi:two-component system, sensor histidine kinase and response regulator